MWAETPRASVAALAELFTLATTALHSRDTATQRQAMVIRRLLIESGIDNAMDLLDSLLDAVDRAPARSFDVLGR